MLYLKLPTFLLGPYGFPGTLFQEMYASHWGCCQFCAFNFLLNYKLHSWLHWDVSWGLHYVINQLCCSSSCGGRYFVVTSDRLTQYMQIKCVTLISYQGKSIMTKVLDLNFSNVYSFLSAFFRFFKKGSIERKETMAVHTIWINSGRWVRYHNDR
jgi:hypothetical protein